MPSIARFSGPLTSLVSHALFRDTDIVGCANMQCYSTGYTSTEVPWYPRPDGYFLKESPHISWKNGNIAKVSVVIAMPLYYHHPELTSVLFSRFQWSSET